MSHQIGYIIGIQKKGVIRFLIHLEILRIRGFQHSMELPSLPLADL